MTGPNRPSLEYYKNHAKETMAAHRGKTFYMSYPLEDRDLARQVEAVISELCPGAEVLDTTIDEAPDIYGPIVDGEIVTCMLVYMVEVRVP